MSKDDIYDILNVDKVINAAGHFTTMGGAKMSRKTLEHIKEAAKSSVNISELQKTVHERIAKMTKNEAAYVCNSAATGIYLAIAASVQMKLKKNYNYIPFDEIQKKEVIMFKAHRNPYDWAIRQLGVKIIDVGYANDIEVIKTEDLEQAITNETVAIFYAAGNEMSWIPPGALPYSEVVKVSKCSNIPLIVDAAAQLPPIDNLWSYTHNGAHAVIFSGGKDLSGPQASGLVLGEKNLLQAIHEIGFPNFGVGRMMKVGREEIIGLYSAIEQYVSMDHDARLEWCENQISNLGNSFKESKLFSIERNFPNVAGQPIPRAFIRIKNHEIITPKKLSKLLLGEAPKVFTNGTNDGIYINTLSLLEGEMEQIIMKLRKIEEAIM